VQFGVRHCRPHASTERDTSRVRKIEGMTWD